MSEAAEISPVRRILVVDDSELICEQIAKILQQAGHEVTTCTQPVRALELLDGSPFCLALVDLRMPGMDGLEFVRRLKTQAPDVSAIVITAHGSIDVAVEAMRAGARDFLTKPFSEEHLRVVVDKVLSECAVRQEVASLRAQLREYQSLGGIISRSPAIRQVLQVVAGAAPMDVTVLIEGETGTGKELLARAIHLASARSRGPFVAVHCGGLPDTLLESELFGHERGAFTGATGRRPGRFERAAGGTLFLDEIGTMPTAMQIKILRVLEDGSYERVGGVETLHSDARIVAAGNENLAELVEQGRFRQDLYYRLNVVSVRLPPLRERPMDILLLAQHFLDRLIQTTNLPGAGRLHGFAPAAIERLLDHAWPGNVRELRNAVERAAFVERGDLITLDSLPETLRKGPRKPAALPVDTGRPLPELTAELVAELEREYLRRLLEQHAGNVTQAAKAAGLSRRSVGEKVRRYGLRGQ